MTTVVGSAAEAIGNISKFEDQVRKNTDLQDRLPFARAWYATKDGQVWRFGPSKFIGYRGLTAKDYIEESQELDGRRTERQLNQWFVTVSPGDPLFDELHNALRDFLEPYGKAPSNLARINVAREVIDGDIGGLDRSIVDLMILVARRLDDTERARLRSAL